MVVIIFIFSHLFPSEKDDFTGIAAAPFPKEIADILLAPVNINDIEIKPDGKYSVLVCM